MSSISNECSDKPKQPNWNATWLGLLILFALCFLCAFLAGITPNAFLFYLLSIFLYGIGLLGLAGTIFSRAVMTIAGKSSLPNRSECKRLLGAIVFAVLYLWGTVLGGSLLVYLVGPKKILEATHELKAKASEGASEKDPRDLILGSADIVPDPLRRLGAVYISIYPNGTIGLKKLGLGDFEGYILIPEDLSHPGLSSGTRIAPGIYWAKRR